MTGIIERQAVIIEEQAQEIVELQENNAQLQAVNAQLQQTINQQAIIISTLDAEVAQLTQTNQQQSQIIIQQQQQIATLQGQIASKDQTIVAYRTSNNAAPVKWGAAFFDQGATPGAPFLQNAANILNGYSRLAITPLGNISPMYPFPTFSMNAQGLQVNIPANWTADTIIFELEFGNQSTEYPNNNELANAMYRLYTMGLSANITVFPYGEQQQPTGAVGGGGFAGILGLRALHRLAYMYNPSALESSITIGCDFVNGGAGSAHPQYAGFSCVYKQYYSTVWSYIP